MPRVSDRARPSSAPAGHKNCEPLSGELENRGWGLENSGSGGGREMSTLAHQSGSKLLELETKVREVFTITEKAPTRAFSLLKVLTSLVLCM